MAETDPNGMGTNGVESLSVNTAVGGEGATSPSPVPAGHAGLESSNVVELSIGNYADRFQRLNTLLGKGANKEVFLAFDTLNNGDVAWNRVARQTLSTKDQRDLEHEISMMDAASHKNIIKYIAVWETENYFVFITDFYNMSLKKFISERNVLINSVKTWTSQILDGLIHLHARGIIHRDIKCDNIYINQKTGDVVIGDLGLSRLSAALGQDNRAQSMSVVGTVPFMAPEQLNVKGVQYGPKVDIYALGMTVLEMISGEYPFVECEALPYIIKNIIDDKPPDSFNRLNDGTTKDFVGLCLTRNPLERPTAEELRNHAWFVHMKDNHPVAGLMMTPEATASAGVISPGTPGLRRQHSLGGSVFPAPLIPESITEGQRVIHPQHQRSKTSPVIGPSKRQSLPPHHLAKTPSVDTHADYMLNAPIRSSKELEEESVEDAEESVGGALPMTLRDSLVPLEMEWRCSPLQNTSINPQPDLSEEEAEKRKFETSISTLKNLAAIVKSASRGLLPEDIQGTMLEVDSAVYTFVEGSDADQRASFHDRAIDLLQKWENMRESLSGWSREIEDHVDTRNENIKKQESALTSAQKKASDYEQQEIEIRKKLNTENSQRQTYREKQQKIDEEIAALKQQREQITLSLDESKGRSDALEQELENLMESQSETTTSIQSISDKLQDLKSDEKINSEKDTIAQFTAWRDSVQGVMNEIQKARELEWKQWSPQEIVDWICRIEKGLFRRYREKLQEEVPSKFEKGEDLVYLLHDRQTIGELGVSKIPHRHMLIKHIERLNRNNPSSLNPNNPVDNPEP